MGKKAEGQTAKRKASRGEEELLRQLKESERARWLAEERAKQERKAFESLAAFTAEELQRPWRQFSHNGDLYEGFVDQTTQQQPEGFGICYFSRHASRILFIFPL
jgi:hypothetical protein